MDVNEREVARARLDLLCSVLHGVPQPDAPDSDADLDALIAAVSADFGDQAQDPVGDANTPEYMNRWWESPEYMRGGDDHGFPDHLVKEAMDKELASFRERGVYVVVPRSRLAECQNPVMLSTKWVIKNKGSASKFEAKARLVAREFVSKDSDKDTLYAATPGLSAMRVLLSRLNSPYPVRGPVLSMDFISFATS